MIAHGDYGEPPPNNPYCNYSNSNLNCPPPTSHVLGHDENKEEFSASTSCVKRTRYRIGKAIECKAAHITILLLTLCDIVLVVLQIGASLLHLDETEHEHWLLALFGHLSLAIVSIFMLEILLKLFSFGPRYYWKGTPHWILHLLDAFIILTSFLLEIFLKGAEQELSSLLIVFRLWRVLKLTGTVAIEVSEHDQAHVALLEEKVKSLEHELEECHLKIQRLEGLNLPKGSSQSIQLE
ncbi:hypothetical protein BG015_005449 [Linnemannia schmuckeri]|uniref:Voltage-gated hydrogen channel 1 n=1 Tax=Linnemannia schmuckeri TaxID=64567 RepID=A0A9P5VCK8_9FUNG|nr:hypothetical protein BG015_005449 [Linnemannia schmuckeri]